MVNSLKCEKPSSVLPVRVGYFFLLKEGWVKAQHQGHLLQVKTFWGFPCNRMRIPVTKERHLVLRWWFHDDTIVPPTLKFCWRRLLRSLISNHRVDLFLVMSVAGQEVWAILYLSFTDEALRCSGRTQRDTFPLINRK